MKEYQVDKQLINTGSSTNREHSKEAVPGK